MASHKPDSAFDEFAAFVLLPAFDEGGLALQIAVVQEGGAARPGGYVDRRA